MRTRMREREEGGGDSPDDDIVSCLVPGESWVVWPVGSLESEVLRERERLDLALPFLRDSGAFHLELIRVTREKLSRGNGEVAEHAREGEGEVVWVDGGRREGSSRWIRRLVRRDLAKGSHLCEVVQW